MSMSDTTASSFVDDFATTTTRLRRGHLALFAFALLIVSFATGISLGLSNRLNSAHAAKLGMGQLFSPGAPDHIAVPSGVVAVRVGDGVEMNGAPAEMVHLASSRPVVPLLTEIVHRWEQQGLRAVGVAAPHRGMAIALNPATGERFSALLHRVPPELRKSVANGYPTQGYLSYVNMAAGKPVESFEDISFPNGTVNGGIVASKDVGGTSASAYFTLPYPVDEAMVWLRGVYDAGGWEEVDRSSAGNYLIYVRAGRERTALFAPVTSKSQGGETGKTLMFLVERNASLGEVR